MCAKSAVCCTRDLCLIFLSCVRHALFLKKLSGAPKSQRHVTVVIVVSSRHCRYEDSSLRNTHFLLVTLKYTKKEQMYVSVCTMCVFDACRDVQQQQEVTNVVFCRYIFVVC